MSFEIQNNGNLKYLSAKNIQNMGGLAHIFTTRHGGVSTGILASLNLGTSRGEDDSIIQENYHRACNAVGLDYTKAVLAKQTHTTNIRIVTKKDCGKGIVCPSDIQDTDGLITNEANIPLVIFYADCVPVLLYDKKARVVAALHAGWRGTVGGIVKKGVQLMQNEFGSKCENIMAAIGPSIGQCHFETGLEVADEFEKAQLSSCIQYRNDKAYIDLWQANLRLLQSAGVKEENIEPANTCTVCNTDDYYSHRGCGAATGRMALIAGLI